MHPTDYLDVTDGGLVVRGSSIEGGGTPAVQFGDEAAIRVPAHVRNLIVRRDGSACAFKSQDGIGYEVTRAGVVTSLGPIYGDEALAYAPDGRLAYIVSRTRWAIDGVARDLPPNRQGTSQGIREFRADGSIRWSDEDYETLKASRTWAGIEFVTWRERGDWVFGNSQVGCAAVNRRTGQASTLPQCNGTSWTLRGALVNGELRVVSSMPAAVVRERDFVPYVPPAVVYAPVVRIGRPLWFGWFFGTDAEPGNCRFADWPTRGHVFVAGPLWRYVAGAPDGDPAAIDRAISDARADEDQWPRGLNDHVLAYVPQRAFHALPTSADLQGIECYLWAGEDDETFLATRAAAIRQCPRVVLVAQCYDNRDASIDLRRVPGLVSRLARDHANVEGILVFSGSGRATGWQDHPEVHDAWRAVFAGITGTPVIDTPPVSQPPAPTPKPDPTPDEPAPEPAPEAPEVPGTGNSGDETASPVQELPPPIAVRPDKPIGGNAIADFFRAIAKLNVRKWLKDLFR